jgi:8-oxo-dGTP pyrophosphatase MutT (NUDIX family)
MVPAVDRHIGISDLRRALQGRMPGELWTGAPPPPRTSAVLIGVYEDKAGTRVVLTRRSDRLRSHSGEVSFPGGGQDEGESLWETALREANEEIGLCSAAILLGELDRLRTVSSNSAIVPFVAELPDGCPELVANPAEVDAILLVPLSELLADDVYREERWRWPDPDDGRPPGIERPIHFFELVGDTVWGATARMLVQLLQLGLGVP